MSKLSLKLINTTRVHETSLISTMKIPLQYLGMNTLGSERSCRTNRSFEPSYEPISHGASDRDGHEKGVGGGVDIVPESGKSQKEMPSLKIDEFGRDFR